MTDDMNGSIWQPSLGRKASTIEQEYAQVAARHQRAIGELILDRDKLRRDVYELQQRFNVMRDYLDERDAPFTSWRAYFRWLFTGRRRAE